MSAIIMELFPPSSITAKPRLFPLNKHRVTPFSVGRDYNVLVVISPHPHLDLLHWQCKSFPNIAHLFLYHAHLLVTPFPSLESTLDLTRSHTCLPSLLSVIKGHSTPSFSLFFCLHDPHDRHFRLLDI